LKKTQETPLYIENSNLKKVVEELESKIVTMHESINRCACIGLTDLDNKIKEAEYNATNKWEKDNGIPNHRFGPAFHIHRATQRYQGSGYKIDGFAEATTKYSDFHAALNQFLVECSFKSEEKGQPSLFKGGGIL
jgi:hypothetical protein